MDIPKTMSCIYAENNFLSMWSLCGNVEQPHNSKCYFCVSAYTIAKYGMSMCVLGMAEEFKGEIAVNALWPKTGDYNICLISNNLCSFS